MGELFRMDMEDGAYMMGLFEGHPPPAPRHAHAPIATPPRLRHAPLRVALGSMSHVTPFEIKSRSLESRDIGSRNFETRDIERVSSSRVILNHVTLSHVTFNHVKSLSFY